MNRKMTQKQYEELLNLLIDMSRDYERFSSSGKVTYDKICKLLDSDSNNEVGGNNADIPDKEYNVPNKEDKKIIIPDGENKQVAAGVLALCLGWFGIHKFYLGYTKQGVLTLVAFLFGWILLFIPNIMIAVISLAEGIIYLTKSEEDFYIEYVQKQKTWF
tara:strand:+ start:1945 stop:2424 length:480 start_codon:yes stop_codon:yes gene_type:complete